MELEYGHYIWIGWYDLGGFVSFRAVVVLLGCCWRLKRVKTGMRGGKGGEGVSHPIPIVRRKMKKRGGGI